MSDIVEQLVQDDGEFNEADVIITNVTPENYHERASECRKRIEHASKNIQSHHYDMCLALEEAFMHDFFKTWGFDGIEDYAERVLKISRRTAYYLLNCGKVIREYRISRERFMEIGWTKMSNVSRYIQDRPKDVNLLLDIAEKSSSRELEDKIREQYEDVKKIEKTDAKPEMFFIRNVKLDGESAKIVEDAINAAFGVIGSGDMADALLHICSEWLMLQGSESGRVTIDNWTAYIERTYGVKLVPEDTPDIEELIGSDDPDIESMLK